MPPSAESPSQTDWDDSRLRIALTIETSGAYGRGVLEGISQYAHLHGPWSFHFVAGDSHYVLPDFKRWEGDGFIGRVDTSFVECLLVEQQIPFVGLDLDPKLDELFRLPQMVEMHPDPDAIARVGIEHFVDRGYKRIAFLGSENRHWALARQTAFEKLIQGYDSMEFVGIQKFNYDDNSLSGFEKREALGNWIASLPKPVAIFACNDDIGRIGLEAALHVNVQVPDEVAMLGVDDDETICELCDPPLSSVQLDSISAGYLAAEMLHRMISGDRLEREVKVAPLKVMTRRSTEAFAVEDKELASALHYIRENAHRAFGVEDVVGATCLSRRVLEQRFRKILRTTMHQEIDKARIARARSLLIDTSLPIEQVAIECGYSSASHFSTSFKRLQNQAPAAFRKGRNA